MKRRNVPILPFVCELNSNAKLNGAMERVAPSFEFLPDAMVLEAEWRTNPALAQQLEEDRAQQSSRAPGAIFLRQGRFALVLRHECDKPIVAGVNGVAAGAGLNLALACDVRWASERATFGETFARIGLHPDWGGTHALPRQVGLANALELCWLGEMIDAAEALRIGLVQRVFADDAFTSEVAARARRLADAPVTSITFAKRTLGASLARTLDQCLDAEAAAQEACWASADSAEGLGAFVAKRVPAFRAGRASSSSARPWSFE